MLGACPACKLILAVECKVFLAPGRGNLAGAARSWGLRAHRIIKGATIKSTVASPSHQVSQIQSNFDHEANPLRQRLETPIVAEVVLLRTAAKSTNLKGVADNLKT